MKPSIAAFAILGLLGGQARAGYENTRWGMTLAQVQKTHPGGRTAEQRGETSYAVLEQVAGLPGLVTFIFGARGLRSVSVVFPQQGSKFDPKADAYAPLGKDDADRVRDAVLQDLKARLGPPALHGEGQVSPLAWATKDGDLVVLTTTRDDPGHATVSVSISSASDAP